MSVNENSDFAVPLFFSLFLLVFVSDLTMGTAAAPQVAPPSWGAPMVNVVCVL